jgi:rare lipoprotein A
MACRLLLLLAATLVAAAPPPAPDRSRRVRSGVASFYGHREAGRTTASGTPLNPRHLTAASRTLPLGTRAKVVNQATGRSVQVTITDRGPYAKDRLLDVTPKAAERLGMTRDGVAPVKVKPVALPPPR